MKPSASIGIAAHSANISSVLELYNFADFALYSCKRFSRGTCRIFDETRKSEIERRKQIEIAFSRAGEDEFYLNYQPIIDAKTGRIKGFEALARWNSPLEGKISPVEFIPIAEQVGLIRKLTDILLEKALKEAKTWPDDITLSFNLSSRDLSSVSYATDIRSLILKSKFPPQRLIIELTETAIVQDTETTQKALKILNEIGVITALDDFGTGYSSITHILDFNIGRIKIEKLLTDQIESDKEKHAIVLSVLNLCKNLNIDCVVEGVQTKEQASLLREMEASLMQGFFYSKPIQPEQVAPLLAKLNAAL